MSLSCVQSILVLQYKPVMTKHGINSMIDVLIWYSYIPPIDSQNNKPVLIDWADSNPPATSLDDPYPRSQ